MIVLTQHELETLSVALESTDSFFAKANEIIDQWSKSTFEIGSYEHTCFLTVRQTINTSVMIIIAASRLDEFTAQQLLRALFVLFHDLVFLVMPSQEEMRQYNFRLFKTHGFFKAQGLLNKTLKGKPDHEETDDDVRFRLQADFEAEVLLSESAELLEKDGLKSTKPHALSSKICEEMEEIRSCYLDSYRVDTDFRNLVRSAIGLEATGSIRDLLIKTLPKHNKQDSGLWYSITSAYSHPSFAALHIGIPEGIASLAASLRWALNLTHASLLTISSRFSEIVNLGSGEFQEFYHEAANAIEHCGLSSGNE